MLDDNSARPYFIRAVYQWCVDHAHTPHLLAHWHEYSSGDIPQRLVNNGKIVFNISAEAVRHLVIGDSGIYFTARFAGKTTEVQIPLADVISIYAMEKQSGITFPPLAPQPTPSPPPKRKADIKII